MLTRYDRNGRRITNTHTGAARIVWALYIAGILAALAALFAVLAIVEFIGSHPILTIAFIVTAPAVAIWASRSPR